MLKKQNLEVPFPFSPTLLIDLWFILTFQTKGAQGTFLPPKFLTNTEQNQKKS